MMDCFEIVIAALVIEKNNCFQVQQKSTDSMTTQSVHDQNVVYVEYCRSCQTHSWCTHHDQAKYHDTYLKLYEMLTQHYPHLEIIGNMVPSHLIPFKIAENKYIDSNTNKYVVYPQIGSFEVRYNSTLIFSKKETNSWPNLNAIVSKISSIINPNYQSPKKIENTQKSPKKSFENTPSKAYKNNDFLKSNDEKKTYYKDQPKGFTLTDHFKIYKSKVKHEDKDWLTEKQQSDGSSKQISEFGRGESRQRSDRGDQFKSVMSDYSGDSKLKEMLKNKGLTLKDHGKKQMIIKLDSIEQENGNYDDYGATQRTAEKPIKKNQKIQELENAFSNLENKFIRFESKVKDIQNKNDNFDYRKPDSNESQININLRETDKSKKDEQKRSNVKQVPSFEKQGGAFVERPSKLEIYLNASEQEKNEKLYRIYGQWKVLKQTEKRNKKLLKNANKNGSNQLSSDDQTSQNNSVSPSSMANVITFKPKMEKNIQKQITSLLKSNKGQKYSTIEKAQTPINIVRNEEPKFRTDDHFYNKSHVRNAKVDSETEKESQEYSSKLFKNTTNTMSLQSLRNGFKQSLSKNASMNQINSSNLSQNAKQNISKINARISNIQAQINKHKQNQLLIKMGLEPQLGKPSHDLNKSRSNSDASSQLSSKKFSYRNKQTHDKNKQEVRNSYRPQYPLKKKGHVALVKRGSKFSEVNGIYNSKKPKNQSTNIQATIQQQSEIHDSNIVTQRSYQHNREQLRTKSNKKQLINRKQESGRKERINKQQQLRYKQNIDSQEQQQISDSQETSQNHTKRQKQSRIQHHDLHEPKVFLRRQKEWREAGSNQSKRKQPKNISQHAEGNSNSPQRESIQANKFRFSEAKNSPSKASKSTNPTTKVKQPQGKVQTPNITNSPREEIKENLMTFQKGQKSSFGKIKKNKKKDEVLLRQNSNSSNGYSIGAPEVEEEARNLEEGDSHYCQQEETGSVNQKNHSPSGRIVRNNSKPLCFYKSQDIVITGQQRDINSASQELNINSSSGRSDAQGYNSYNEDMINQEQRNIVNIKKGQSRRSSNEKVEGWETNSGPQEDQLPAAQNLDQDRRSDDAGGSFQEQKQRRNSLDKELEQNQYRQLEGIPSNQHRQSLEQDRQEAELQIQTANVPFQTNSVDNHNTNIASPYVSQSVSVAHQVYAPATVPLSSQTTTSCKVVEPQHEKAKVSNAVQDAIQNAKSSNNNEIQKEQNPKKMKKAKKAKKAKAQKQGKKQTKVLKQAKLENNNDQQEELQKIVCKQYASYLQIKIANDFSKQQTPQNPIENNQYEDVEVTVHVNYCPSIETIPQGQEHIPCSFVDYNPVLAVVEQQERANNSEYEQENTEEQYQSDQQSYQIEKESAKETEKIEKLEEVAKQQIIQQQIVYDTNQACITAIPLASAIQNTNTLPLSPQIPEQSNQPKLASSPSPHDPTSTSLQPIQEHQANNVYSQPKEPNKFKEIGVQKESTLQVSVQTDHPQTIYPIALTRVNSSSNPPQENQQESARNIFQLQETKSDFNNTIRNNFVTQSRKTAFQKKAKKQIERADIINKIYSQDLAEQFEKFGQVIKGQFEKIVKEEGLAVKLEEFYPNGSLIGQKGLEVELISTKFVNLLKITEILTEKSEWLISRLFEDRHGILKSKAFGVWLCHQYEWKCIIVDQHLLVDQQNQPLFSQHHGNQMWFNILEKALSVALGGYQQVRKAETSLLFTMLTGCNAISAKIKEDPTKNAKLLHLISDCLRKNYIIHAHKNYDKIKQDEGREAVYYVCSVRRSGEEETLIEVSQDGRESFWLKLSKFVQEFNKIDILHLRVNHNFAHLDLGVGRPGQLTVIELGFFDEGQGCVTLSYLGQSGSLKAYLYKQQKNKVLKLVGQAKQKLKSHLFFECSFSEGRYFVFAQAEEKPTRIAFLGQAQPSIRITEEIHSEGLKNDLAEYLPVKDNDQHRLKQRSQLQSGNQWRQRRAPRLKDNFMESRLRQTFMDYVIGRGRRN